MKHPSCQTPATLACPFPFGPLPSFIIDFLNHLQLVSVELPVVELQVGRESEDKHLHLSEAPQARTRHRWSKVQLL